MNMQTIQILWLLLDGIVKLAPWRIVTETMDRIGYAASESPARSFGAVAVVCAGLCVFPPAPILGAILPAGYVGGAMASLVRMGSPLFSRVLLESYPGVMVRGGLRLRDGKRRSVNAAAGLIRPVDNYI